MGLLEFFSRRDPGGRIKFLVNVEEGMYRAAQDEAPERDCNAWLARCLLSLPESVSLDIQRTVVTDPKLPFVVTARFSLDPGSAAKQLGLFVALSDFRAYYGNSHPGPKAAALYNEYAEALQTLNAQFSATVAAGTFESIWRQRNPWTARQMPDVGKLAIEAVA